MPASSPTSKGVVAIIDDEVDITTYLRLALEDHGWEVLTINESAEAVEQLQGRALDVILLDLLMPQMTGLSVYGRIVSHAALSQVPIVILSGLNAREDLPDLLARQEQPLPAPAAFIDKPVKLPVVLSTLEKVLAPRQTREAS